MKKLLIFFAITLTTIIIGCTGNNKHMPDNPATAESSPGKEVYTKYCRLCHGNAGDLGLSGSANLTITVLTVDEIKLVVTNGRKAMPAWGSQLSPQQIDDVANYVLTLKN